MGHLVGCDWPGWATNFHNLTIPLKATRTLCITYYKYSLRFNFTCGDVIGSCWVSPIDVKVPSFCHIDSIVILNSAIWWPNNFYNHMDIVYSIEGDGKISLKQYDSRRTVSNCTRKRSSMMPTPRLPIIQASWWSTLNMSGTHMGRPRTPTDTTENITFPNLRWWAVKN